MRFIIPVPEKQALLSSSVSPDGRRLVFCVSAAGKQQLWTRQLDSLTAQPLPGTDKANPAPVFWSPDSRYIGFFTDQKLKKMELSGGIAQTIADAPNPRGGSWNRIGVIVFSPNAMGPLYRVSATGGEMTQITTLDESRQETSHRWPFFLPDGRHFLYLARSSQIENTAIYVGSLESKETKRLISADSGVAYGPPGYLLFSREGTLMAQPFDADKLQVMGEASPVAERVYLYPGYPSFSISNTGVLVYMTGGPTNQLTWFDRSGKQLGTVGQPGRYRVFRLSPDEKRVAVVRIDPPAVRSDIWVIELTRGVASRLTSDPGDDIAPEWSPDGSRIAFSSNRDGKFDLYEKLSSGAGSDEELLKSSEAKFMNCWSADGRYILYESIGVNSKSDIWVLPMFGERKPYPFLKTEFNERSASFSPNGRWVAYTSNETGIFEVYVREFQGSGGKWQVSTVGGTFPRWRWDGKEIFYTSGGKLMSVDVNASGSRFEPGVPRLLFDKNIENDYYDLTRDGQRFLVRVPVEEISSPPITVVLNWTADLKR